MMNNHIPSTFSDIFSFHILNLLGNDSLMVSPKELHQEIETWTLIFTLRLLVETQHFFPDLKNSVLRKIMNLKNSPDRLSATRAFLAEVPQILKACRGSETRCSLAVHGQLFLGFLELGQLPSIHLHLK